MDFGKFRKVQTNQTSTVLQHPDGHKIRIAHAGLSKEHKAALDNEPVHYADGGAVRSEADPRFDDPQPASTIDSAMDALKYPSPTQNSTPIPVDYTLKQPKMFMPGDEEPAAQMFTPAAAAPEPAASADMSAGQFDLNGGMQQQRQVAMPAMPTNGGGIAQMKSALNKQAATAATQGASEYEAANQYADQAQITQQHFDQQFTDLNGERAALMKDYVANKIDPKHFMDTRTIGNKASMAIGLLLGGLSAGITGKDNPAITAIDKQIEQDIEAQRVNLGKQKTLLDFNQQKFGNNKDAVDMTRAFLKDMYAANVAKAAATSRGPNAMAAAKMLGAQYQMEADKLTAGVAQNQAIKTMAASGQIDPAEAVPHLVPKEHQAAVFKEIQMAQNTQHMGQSILGSFEQAVKENTIGRTLGMRTPGSVLALHQSMQPTFQDLEGTVRQAAMDNTFKNITPSPGDSEHTVATKRAALKEYLQSKMSAPVAKGYGIDLSKLKSTRPATGPGFTKR